MKIIFVGNDVEIHGGYYFYKRRKDNGELRVSNTEEGGFIIEVGYRAIEINNPKTFIELIIALEKNYNREESIHIYPAKIEDEEEFQEDEDHIPIDSEDDN